MNLTSKRMLQVLSACVSAVALTASAQTTNWVQDSFEEVPFDTPAWQYKSHIWGDGFSNQFWTNSSWTAANGVDASLIAETTLDYIGTPPLEGVAAHTKALNLNTEGATLIRHVAFTHGGDVNQDTLVAPSSIGIGGEDHPVYVDTMMKFTPSEDEPSDFGTLPKLALWVNAASNLVVRHSWFDFNYGFRSTPINSELSQSINPDLWYRVTIKMWTNPEESFLLEEVCLFSIQINGGDPLEHIDALGWDDTLPGDMVRGGPIFGAISRNITSLQHVAFQGTGWVDDLVVTDVEPVFGPSTGVLLTLAFNDAKLGVKVNNVLVASGDTVAGGKTVSIEAADWYVLDSVAITGAGNSILYAGGVTDPADAKSVTGTVTVAIAGTMTITAKEYEAEDVFNTGLGGEYASIEYSKLKKWATKTEQSEASALASIMDPANIDDYLLNVAPGTDAGILIGSINIDNDMAIITVVPTLLVVDLMDINGTLRIMTCATLGGAWTTRDIDFTFPIIVDDNGDPVLDVSNNPVLGDATVEVPITSGHFMKATVK